MAKNVIIIGGGGLAYESYLYLGDVMREDSSVSFGGFAAPDCPTLKNYSMESMNMGPEETIPAREGDFYVIGVANPAVRKRIFESLKERGKRLFNLIHPSARISAHTLANMGDGNIFAPYSGASSVSLGDCNVVNCFSGFAHDTHVGSFNVISSYCDICGYVKIGDCNFLGSHAALLPKAKIGSMNKIAAASVVYKGCGDGVIMLGNPAEIIGDA